MTDQENPPDPRGPDAPASSKPPHPIYNWRSFIGFSIATVGFTAGGFFLLIGLITADESGYAGLTLIPPVLAVLFGAALVASGWEREARRQRRGDRSSFFDSWTVDPFDLVRRIGPFAAVAGVAVATAALLAGAAGSVAVVEFTESNTFCTEACHSVMGPEAVAWADTVHSQIDCVQCHVASGAEGYLAAKIGGLRQLWGMVSGNIERPIPTPLHGGPISRELCEGCHALERHADHKALTRRYFPTGAEDTPVRVAMMVNTGGNASNGFAGGIHYHMQVAKTVEYVARDKARQEIAWIRVTEPGGDTREYNNDGAPLSEEERASLPVRQMNCIDCHSRPAHLFTSPIDSVNAAFGAARLPTDIPGLKEASVRALDGEYETTDRALAGIEETVHAFYQEEDPDVLEDRAEEIAHSVETLRAIYQRTIFPEMKADWLAHPNNAGHRDTVGCFRCHNDEMVDDEGEAIFTDCSRCHSVLAQDDEAISTMAEFDTGSGFVHPEDGSRFDEFTLCSDCHTGGKALYE